MLFSKGLVLSEPYEYIGCYKSGSVPTLEGNRTDPQRKCYEAANERGWSLFTVSDGGACNSGPDGIYTYQAKGTADCGYKGGSGTASVFLITGKFYRQFTYISNFIHIMCPCVKAPFIRKTHSM